MLVGSYLSFYGTVPAPSVYILRVPYMYRVYTTTHLNLTCITKLRSGQHIFPGDVNKTHPSRQKYYYMEGSDGVKLPGGESRKPYNWTAEDLMSDLEEFLGDSFRIAHILDGTPF